LPIERWERIGVGAKLVSSPNSQNDYSLLFAWVQKTLIDHAQAARSVSSLALSRLPLYYAPNLLACTRIALVPSVPVPPLPAMGLDGCDHFNRPDREGVTYLDVCFVREDHTSLEPLLFKELVHIIQWRVLGPERFLAFYFDECEPSRQRDNPLEAMAHALHARFVRETEPFNVSAACRHQIGDVIRCADRHSALLLPDNMRLASTSGSGKRGLSTPLTQHHTGKRILVVDDEHAIREIAAIALTDAGYQVETAEDGASAWEALGAGRYDLVITDNRMPKVSGVELVKKLRTESVRIPVIMATATAPPELLNQDPKFQISGLLLKPFSIKELLGSVRSILRTADNMIHGSESGFSGQN